MRVNDKLFKKIVSGKRGGGNDHIHVERYRSGIFS